MDMHELTQKWHGLPIYVWIGGGGLLLGGAVIYMRKRAGTGGTSSADVADNTPGAADNGATDNGSMPWSGGAPTSDGSVDALTGLVGNLADQEQADAESGANAIRAAMTEAEANNLARQNDLAAMAANNAASAEANSSAYAALVASTNDAIRKATSAAPPPSQANIPAKQAQPGIGDSHSSFLPPATVLIASKNAGKNKNSGIHAM